MAIEIFRPKQNALAIFDKPLKPITSALLTGNKLREKYSGTIAPYLQHRKDYVQTAIRVRNERLSEFVQADEARGTLYCAMMMESLEKPVGIAMVTALYHAVGVKLGDETAGMVAGVLDMLEGDEIGRASGLWEPLNVTPAILALASRKLITTSVFPPKPAELRTACKEARDKLFWAQKAADETCEIARKADAVLLEFHRDEWERPWLLPQYRPLLARMLSLHSASAYEYGHEGEDEELTPFERLIEAERAKLAIADQSHERKLAASRKPASVRRSKATK